MNSDDENDFQPQWKGVPGTIILINAFENSKYQHFGIGHVATCRLLRQYMRLANSLNVGVCVFGIEELNDSTFNSKAVWEIVPLSVPTVDNYKKLKKFNISSCNEAKEFKMADAMWHCTKMFANFKRQLSCRQVIMLTRLDTLPVAIDQEPTLNRARDLVDANIDLKIINISEHEYKINNSFYEKLLKIAGKGLDVDIPEPMWDSLQIEKLMHQQSHRHLVLAKLNFEIGDNFNIGVGVYTLLKSDKYQKNVNLNRETNTILTTVTKTLKISVGYDDDDVDEDGEQLSNKPKEVPLLKSELLHYQEYGGEHIQFTDNEMKTIKNPFGPPMLKLLGFKPTTNICKEKWYLKQSYFLFPNESTIEGSTVAFKALHKACKDMQMVAICVLCTRVNARPVIVALSPSSKPLNLNIDIGFDVIPIPFVENVRDLNMKEEDDDEETSSIAKAHKSIMKDIINTASVDFQPYMFEDPKLQSLYTALETIALGDDDDVEPFIDTTKPNPEKFEDIRYDLFEELFGPFNVTLKRTAPKLPSEGNKKKKVEGIDEDILRKRLLAKEINKYTVSELKEILKNYTFNEKVPTLTGLKKDDLIQHVYKLVRM